MFPYFTLLLEFFYEYISRKSIIIEIFGAMHWHLSVLQSRCYLECVTRADDLLWVEDYSAETLARWASSSLCGLTTSCWSGSRPLYQVQWQRKRQEEQKKTKTEQNKNKMLLNLIWLKGFFSTKETNGGWDKWMWMEIFSPWKLSSTCAVMCFDELCCRYSLCMKAKK